MNVTTIDAQNLYGQIKDVIGSSVFLDHFNIFSFLWY